MQQTLDISLPTLENLLHEGSPHDQWPLKLWKETYQQKLEKQVSNYGMSLIILANQKNTWLIKQLELKVTVVIQLYGALGYRTHPQFGNFIIACFQTENIAKILGYKVHRCLGSKDQSSLL